MVAPFVQTTRSGGESRREGDADPWTGHGWSVDLRRRPSCRPIWAAIRPASLPVSPVPPGAARCYLRNWKRGVTMERSSVLPEGRRLALATCALAAVALIIA